MRQVPTKEVGEQDMGVLTIAFEKMFSPSAFSPSSPHPCVGSLCCDPAQSIPSLSSPAPHPLGPGVAMPLLGGGESDSGSSLPPIPRG